MFIIVLSVAAAISALSFIVGFTMERFKYFPYSLIRNFAVHLANTISTPNERLSSQYSHDEEKAAIGKDIDTTLLPLKLKGWRISDYIQIPKVGGGITTIGSTIIVLDRIGNIYAASPDGIVSKLPIPALPNNITEYVSEGLVVSEIRFRAYSIKYLESVKKLVSSHEYYDPQIRATRLAVSVIDFDPETMRSTGSWNTIFYGEPALVGPNVGGGGGLTVGGPDKVYLTIGDYGMENVAQDPTSTLGKIIEISIDTRAHKIMTIGHRNPQGLTATKDGALWSTEHGPRGGDELNLIVEGANYGWPNVTLGSEYETYGWRNDERVGCHDGYQAPIFAWLPGIGVSNLIQIERFHPRWDGDLLVGSLKALSLFRLRTDQTRVVYSEAIWIGQRIRDVAQLKDGTIVLWTDDTELLFLSPNEDKLSGKERFPDLPATVVGDCMYCHSFEPTQAGDFAPSLGNLFGRRIASENFRYSIGLRSKKGTWNEKLLSDFLGNPDKFASGTSMPWPNLSRADIENIIATLKRVSKP